MRNFLFCYRYYWPLMLIFSMILPTVIPWYFFGESLFDAYNVCFVLRLLYTLHDTFLINSFAHWTGMKPYDKYDPPSIVSFAMVLILKYNFRTIRPTDHPLLGIMTLGEGWHNYHHVFPWDYKTAELGNYRFNMTTAFIDFFAKIGRYQGTSRH